MAHDRDAGSIAVVLVAPDIAPNAGAVLRLTACLGVPLAVIEPCGFVWSDRKLARAALDYAAAAVLTRHASWEAFLVQTGLAQTGLAQTGLAQMGLAQTSLAQAGGPPTAGTGVSGRRLVAVEPDGAVPLPAFRFAPGDQLLFGAESTGLSPTARAAATTSLRIPMRPGLRSLNVATACAMVVGAALTQLAGWPQVPAEPV